MQFQSSLLEHIFDQLINSFLDDKVGVSTQFLNKELALSLKLNLSKLFLNNSFKDAGTSNSQIVVNKLVRSDKIYWLDREHQNSVENDFFDLMDAFVLYLNRTCYAGITSYEFHYALYEEGSFYSRHLDQFRNNDSRKFSMILYLNEHWKAEDGGMLRLHHKDESIQDIPPESGTCVFFKSNEIPHEVLLANKARMSVTGWLKVDESI